MQLNAFNHLFWQAYFDTRLHEEQTVAYRLQEAYPEMLVAPPLYDLPEEPAIWLHVVTGLLSRHPITSPRMLDALFTPQQAPGSSGVSLTNVLDAQACGEVFAAWIYGLFLPAILSGHMERYYQRYIDKHQFVVSVMREHSAPALERIAQESGSESRYRLAMARAIHLSFDNGQPLYVGVHPWHIENWDAHYLQSPPVLEYQGDGLYMYARSQYIEASSHQEALWAARRLFKRRIR